MIVPPELVDGLEIKPPYFFGEYDEHEARALLVADPFATSGWLSHCRAYSDAIGVRRNLRAQIRHLLARVAPLDALDFLVRRPLPEHLETPARVLRQLVAQQGQARVLDLGGGSATTSTC